jgi:hypothetical protein
VFISVLVIRLPALPMGFAGFKKYMLLITIPVFYGIVWRYVVGYFNDML